MIQCFFFLLIRQSSDFGQKTLPTPIDNLVRNFTSQDLEKFEGVLAEITNTRTAATKAEWNLYNSIFFCMTVTTTIGKLSIRQFRNENGTWAELCPIIISGIVKGYEPVSYWPVFFPVLNSSLRSLCESSLGPVPFWFLKWRIDYVRIPPLSF